MTKEGWTTFLISLASTFIAVGVSFGICIARIETLEDCARVSKSDHDTVIGLVIKIDRLLDDMQEVKNDLKDIKNKIK